VAVVARSPSREESLDHLLRQLDGRSPGSRFAGLAGRLCPRRREPASGRGDAPVAPRPSAASPDDSAPSHDEVSRLATTLNEMLARLEAAFEHERRFVADASHELRTPLALLRAEIEVTLRRKRTAAELEATLRSAGEEAQRLSRLAEHLLLMARADRGPLPLRRETIPVEAVLDTVARRFAVSNGGNGAIRVEATGAVLEADPDRLAQAITNLVDNALVHGAGPIVLSAIERGTRSSCMVDSGGRFSGSSCLGRSIASAAPTRRGGKAGRGSDSRSPS
jgi:signal transduction histidine kinase